MMSLIRPPRQRATAFLPPILALAAGAFLLLSSPPPGSSWAVGEGMIQDAPDAGVLLLALGVFLASWAWPGADSWRLGPITLFRTWVAIAAGLGAWACLTAVKTKTTILPWPDGDRFLWLDDDMMISMRYARNLARGEGLVWNAGEPPVEGYTNFLWVLVMAVPHLIGAPDRLTSGPIILLNMELALVALLLGVRLALDWGVRPSLAALGALLIAGNRWFIHWTVSGGEGILLACLVLGAALGMTRATRARPAGTAVGLVLGLALLTRTDAVAVAAGFMISLLWLARSGRVRVRAFVIPAAMFLGHLAFRRVYYGEWLPNTYFLKSVDLPMKTPMGVRYSVNFIFHIGSVLLLSLAALAAAGSRRARALALVPWAHIAYVALAGGDELPEMRFYVPIVPILIISAMAGAETLLRAARPRWTAPAGFGWLALGLCLTLARTLTTPAALSSLGGERGETEKNNLRLGMILKQNTAPDARIAHYWAGAAPYFSDRPAIDLLGKSDPVIARSKAHPGEWPPGHNKYDLTYSLGLGPDVVVTALPLFFTDPAARRAEPTSQTYKGLFAIYDEPAFQENYLPVPIDLSRDFHGVFVRRGTTKAKPPEEWVGGW